MQNKAVKWFNDKGISKNTLEKCNITSEVAWMPQTNKEENCIVFNYYMAGELINKKYRDGRKNMKLENESRRLRERLYELNLLEERLLIIRRDPLYEAISDAEEGLKMINYSFGKISIKTAVVSKNINMLRKDLSKLKSGKHILKLIPSCSMRR